MTFEKVHFCVFSNFIDKVDTAIKFENSKFILSVQFVF